MAIWQISRFCNGNLDNLVDEAGDVYDGVAFRGSAT